MHKPAKDRSCRAVPSNGDFRARQTATFLYLELEL